MKEYVKPIFTKTQFISSDAISSGVETTWGAAFNPTLYPDVVCDCDENSCVKPCDSCGDVLQIPGSL